MGWNQVGNIRGPQGLQGIQGDIGPQGPQGPAGDGGPSYPALPTGVVASTLARNSHTLSTVTILATGRLSLVGLRLLEGMTVNSITFISGSTAMGVPTNHWFALYTENLALLRQTIDAGNAAWPSQTEKTLALTSELVIPSTGMYYIGIMVKATTVPNLQGGNSHATMLGLPPILCGSSTSGLTDTAPDPAAALTTLSAFPYAHLSS